MISCFAFCRPPSTKPKCASLVERLSQGVPFVGAHLSSSCINKARACACVPILCMCLYLVSSPKNTTLCMKPPPSAPRVSGVSPPFLCLLPWLVAMRCRSLCSASHTQHTETAHTPYGCIACCQAQARPRACRLSSSLHQEEACAYMMYSLPTAPTILPSSHENTPPFIFGRLSITSRAALLLPRPRHVAHTPPHRANEVRVTTFFYRCTHTRTQVLKPRVMRCRLSNRIQVTEFAKTP